MSKNPASSAKNFALRVRRKRVQKRVIGAAEKAERFVGEYLIDLNATKAAIRAGFSAKTARSAGHRLLTNVDIAAAIEAAKNARAERTRTDSDWVLARLRMEADADLADIYHRNGTLKPVHEWPLIWRTGLVFSVEVVELWEGKGEKRQLVGQRVRLRLADRFPRVVAIGKHVNVNAFREIIGHDASDSLNEAFDAMIERASVFQPMA